MSTYLYSFSSDADAFSSCLKLSNHLMFIMILLDINLPIVWAISELQLQSLREDSDHSCDCKSNYLLHTIHSDIALRKCSAFSLYLPRLLLFKYI